MTSCHHPTLYLSTCLGGTVYLPISWYYGKVYKNYIIGRFSLTSYKYCNCAAGGTNPHRLWISKKIEHWILLKEPSTYLFLYRFIRKRFPVWLPTSTSNFLDKRMCYITTCQCQQSPQAQLLEWVEQLFVWNWNSWRLMIYILFVGSSSKGMPK